MFKFLLKVAVINPPEVEYLPYFSPLLENNPLNTPPFTYLFLILLLD